MKYRILFPIIVCALCLSILLFPSFTAQAISVTPSRSSFDKNLTLRILHGDEVLQMSLSSYLAGVVSAEMPQEFPAEALKAQAVAARTFALRQAETHKHTQADICTNSDCCQAWSAEANENARQAVLETDGLVVTYANTLIEATYFSCSGGTTEPAAAVWGSDVPYLQSVLSPGEEDAPRYSETVEIEAELFRARLLSIYPEMQLIGSAPNWFGTILYTSGGGVASVELGGIEVSGTSLRGLFALRSTDMQFAVTDEIIKITTHGFGHRVGMSQYGAKAMADAGSDFSQILMHYYQNTEIKRLFHTEEA